MLSATRTVKEGSVASVPFTGLQVLQNRLVQFSFFNLLLVALLGVLLRAFPFLEGFPLSYKNVLHGHSHFAFGGWLMPMLLALQLHYFPEITQRVAHQHWRNIAILLLASAYGMLVSFPVQGYRLVSIVFSTLSVGAGYYWAIIVWQALRGRPRSTSTRFLQWGLIYLSISAIGPFATGPLIVMGYQGSPLYYNAVYYYLHFQYNGWFTFAVLALLYQLIGQKGSDENGKKVFLLFNAACLPTFCLSLLWNKPGLAFNLIGGFGALLQCVALYYLVKDLITCCRLKMFNILFAIAFIALFLKLVLQLLSAFPAIAAMAYQYRNFVIAYLHLVLLGFISVFAFAFIVKWYHMHWSRALKVGMALFFFSFCITESLLVMQALSGIKGFLIPNYPAVLLLCSIGFPLGVLFVCYSLNSAIKNNCVSEQTPLAFVRSFIASN